MVKEIKKHKKLLDEIIEVVNEALSSYLGDDIKVNDDSYDKNPEWQFHVKTDWMSKNRGIFEHVISKYYIEADVIRHEFENDNQKYRNGNVYRIYPHIGWYHFNGGTNGHNMEPEMIVIEKDSICKKWDISLKLR
jgi:hypothetical protein